MTQTVEDYYSPNILRYGKFLSTRHVLIYTKGRIETTLKRVHTKGTTAYYGTLEYVFWHTQKRHSRY